MNIWLAEIWRAWRASLRRPGFLLLAAGVLTLGIGASVAVFTLIDDTLLQPLPVPQPSRLVVMGWLNQGKVGLVSPWQYQHMAGLNGVASMGLEKPETSVDIAGGHGRPELVHTTHIDAGLLPTLGVRPLLGRNFSREETRPGGAHVVILTYRFWQQRFGGNRNVIGRTLLIGGITHTIVGVLPHRYAALGFGGDIVLPLALPPDDQDQGINETVVARLAPSANPAAVGNELDARMHAEYKKEAAAATAGSGWMHTPFGVENFSTFLHDKDRPVLGLFLVSALFVLAIALVNLTNLMLFRALSRSHDAAVRSALGAPPFRQVLPALAEGLLVGVGGTLLGLLLAFVGLHALRGFVPGDWLNGATLHFGAWTWGAAFVAGVLGALLATSLGVWRSRATGTMEELRAGERGGISRRGHHLGRVLVVLQVVLATALLCAVGLFMHTLYAAARTSLGIAPGNMLTFELAPVHSDYPNATAVNRLAQSILRRLDGIPGVAAATVTTNLPVDRGARGQFNSDFNTPNGQSFVSQYHGVGPGFFRLFDIRVLAGRAFTSDDVRGSDRVAIVDQTVSKRVYAGHALGKLLTQNFGKHRWSARIVGVVDNTDQEGPMHGPDPVIYVPLAQATNGFLESVLGFEPLRFAVQVRGNPYRYRDPVRRVVAGIAPNQPIANFRSMHDVVASTTAPLRLNLLLVGIFAALALLLAAAGLYAVMSVAVATREHELGVRAAVGATPGALLRHVLGDGLVQIGIGLGFGVFLALVLSVTLRSVIEALGSTKVIDPLSIIGACVVLAIAGLLACLLPALHAACIPPMHALRGE